MAVQGNMRGFSDSGRASQLALQGVGRDLEAQESGRALCRVEGGAGQNGQKNYGTKDQKEMKTNAAQELKSALDKCEDIEASLVKESKLLGDSAAELDALQRIIEISDTGQLQRMVTLLAIAQVGGTRRSYRHHEMDAAQKALTAHCQIFVREALAPRLRDLEVRARARVEMKLKPHFPPESDALRAASNHSTELTALTPIQADVVIHDYSEDGAMRQAKILLDAWAAAGAFEVKHLS
jgi:hypothetical protein